MDQDPDCYHECFSGYYNSWNNGPTKDQATCKPCYGSCLECFWDSEVDCLACGIGEYVESDLIYDLIETGHPFETLSPIELKGRCVATCSDRNGPLNGWCQPCPDHCSMCNEGACEAGACDTGFRNSANGTCEVDCSFVLTSGDSYCTSCFNDQCLEC